MIQDLNTFLTSASLEESEFLQRYPHPVLVLDPFASQEVPAFGTRLPDPVAGHARGVAVLVKRDGSASFRLMVTVGRASTNDVQIPADDVSKFHGYFLRRPREEQIYFADAGSTFGSEVNGVSLVPREPVPLECGARMRLGSVQGTFFSPQGFRSYLLER